MKVIAHGRRPGERRQRTTYDMDGHVLIAGTRERQRIALDSGQPTEKRATTVAPKASPGPKPTPTKTASPAKPPQVAPGKLFPGMRRAENTMAQQAKK